MELKEAFEFFNSRLFEGKLENCIITLERKASVRGFFVKNRFIDESGKMKNQISLNPFYFKKKGLEATLMTLCHEMCHLKTALEGKFHTKGYHDSVWADEMKKIGLQPSSTGKKGGRETGFRMSQYVISGGPFEKAFKELKSRNYEITYSDRITEGCFTQKEYEMLAFDEKEVNIKREGDKVRVSRKRSGIRYKYTCGCSSVWGKKGLKMKCLKCGMDFILKE